MGDIFILIFKKITILNSILMIVHCLFHPDFGEFDYMYMVVILLLISWIAWLIGKVLNLLISNKERKEKNTYIKVIYTTRNQQYACVIILSDFKYSARIKPFPFNDRLGISI